MICPYQIKQQLLKALSLTKDRTKLVMVQRVVHKPGVKTFIQTFYVKPDQVQKTDHVIAGHQNLPNNHPQHSLQVKFSKEIKQQTHEFFSKYTTTTEAYIALKKLGIGWEHSNSAGKNLIRAKRALNQAIQSGFVIPQQSTTPSATTSADLVDIPSDATPAQKKLAELINKMTDIDTIKKCTVMGIVPEDDVAKDFIIDTLMKKLRDAVTFGKNQNSDVPDSIIQSFQQDLESSNLNDDDLWQTVDSSKNNLDSSKIVQNFMLPKGNSADKPVITAMSQFMDEFDINKVIYPQSYFTDCCFDEDSPFQQLSHDHLDLLIDINFGYQDYNADSSSQQSGIIQLFQKIKQQNPTISKEIDTRINQYNNLISTLPSKSFPEKTILKLYKKAAKNLEDTDPESDEMKVFTSVNRLFGISVDPTNITSSMKIDNSSTNTTILSNLLLARDFIHSLEGIYDDITTNQPNQFLDSIPIYSKQEIEAVSQHYNTVDPSQVSLGVELQPAANTPLKDIVYKPLKTLLAYVPNSSTPKQQSSSSASNTSLKSARQQLFNQAKLSLATESMESSDKMRQDILQNKFDYKPGDTDVLGYKYKGNLYDGSYDGKQRFALFNSRFFKVNNSIWEERMNTKIQQLKQQYPDHPEYYEVNQGFHGTTYWSAANILGREGEFHIGDNDLTTNGAMFGAGIYMGDRLGKTIPYVGNDSYSMLFQESLSEDDADGIMILADYIKGDHIFQGANTKDWKVKDIPEKTTCVLAGPSNSKVKAAEIVLKSSEQICPQYIVDISGRAMVPISDDTIINYSSGTEEAFVGNIQQDENGNFGYYSQSTEDYGDFKVVYTADGKNVNIK